MPTGVIVLHILKAHSVRERVTACTGLDVPGTWLDRSPTVERAEELFVGEQRSHGCAQGARRMIRRAPSVVGLVVAATASR
ncbi:hypothetical protein ACN6LC_002361 [Streptomyces violaceoruber]|uniref:Uncharacterized protein n=1 Tax=Streptomyces coelicolor (strain ATCC BAA-471 / A3(2) / M145) TaxID=100226 RepID=Q9F2Y2_STRCO|nr:MULTISPECIES: hypothetical protein [Streptomyces]MDX2927893.1 hypothetical protein [Streptomyces sp. NRRL_B-16638]MDX3403956.1 hypothetical protein [Streptomyces sp. ME01-18h]MDX3411046.1 hypothetical protein [Streptomyces sp. ME02-6977A]MYU43885.1 hypothetical protein [Streptomyces sp. SID7813]NSL83155.1 hypothetical protein [Streptomyces coelicolor]